MARKTKAELAAEAQEREATRQAHEFAAYPTLLLNGLEAATKDGFTLTVDEQMFVVTSYNMDTVYKLPPVHTKQGYYDLLELGWELERRAEERAEAERQLNLARNAFNKLTKEEQAALGLTSRFNW